MTVATLRSDLLAGVITGIVALPLSMGLGIASGVPPEHGLYTAIIAGTVAALAGGAPRQVTGPTAAFVVLLAPVSARYGLGGLCLASLMAGVLLLVLAVFRLGTWVRFVPHPVTLGFTGGIAITIATLQLKDFLGLPIAAMPDNYFLKVAKLVQALPNAHGADAAAGILTLAILLLWPKLKSPVPAALVALTSVTLLTSVAHVFSSDVSVATISSRFSYLIGDVRMAGIPRLPPVPSLDWFTLGPNSITVPVTWGLALTLLPSAIGICLLAAIESLLAAVIADGMGNTRHNSDAELLGLGLANMAAPFFGGFAATGAIARTAINIRSGAKTPLAAVFHAVFVLFAMLSLAPILGALPMASLAALLLTVAWNMGDAPGIAKALKTAPRGDVAVMLVCISLTVVVDMMAAVAAGMMLATILFAVRMAQSSVGHLATEHDPQTKCALPKGINIYDVSGPIFFGAAERALSGLGEVRPSVDCVVIDLSEAFIIDASGIAFLQGMTATLGRQDTRVVLVPPLNEVARHALRKAGLLRPHNNLQAAENRQAALSRAQIVPPMLNA